MHWSWLALLLLPIPASAQEKMRAGDFRAMPAERIADMLLPAGHVPIARVAFDRFGGWMPPSFGAMVKGMRFYSTSAPVSADFCVQNEIVAEITPMPDADDAWFDGPPKVLRQAMARRLYRYRAPGEACDGTQPHFDIYGVGVEQGLDAYRALVEAVKQAHARKPMSFTVSCQALFCGTSRAEIRNLPYAEILSIRLLPAADNRGRDRLARLGRMPGRTVIEFALPLRIDRQIHIYAVLHQDRIEHVTVSESQVVF